jgi:hypothetical protein
MLNDIIINNIRMVARDGIVLAEFTDYYVFNGSQYATNGSVPDSV